MDNEQLEFLRRLENFLTDEKKKARNANTKESIDDLLQNIWDFVDEMQA